MEEEEEQEEEEEEAVEEEKEEAGEEEEEVVGEEKTEPNYLCGRVGVLHAEVEVEQQLSVRVLCVWYVCVLCVCVWQKEAAKLLRKYEIVC